MKPIKLAILLCFLVGCATPTSLVLHVEQTEAVAQASFDAFLRLDNANRPFYRTNAPPLHRFAEWLREPVALRATPGLTNATLPRVSALLWDLDQTKLAFEKGKASSNVLVQALAPVETTLLEVQDMLSNTNNTH